ncbi:cytochrome d ubiquinol oxidase subunit II, partial [Klebsiella pneumoniae]|uniref:cytochrome d ubiquinol oxidase subunit II n=1 Tax=Klebsiella pneumoniae TaxID=573 RepID=UPI0026E0B47B
KPPAHSPEENMVRQKCSGIRRSYLGISIWPTIIPPSVSLRQAAAPVMSQSFMLAGSLVIIPVILVYTFWSYYVFRGKVRTDDGYH